MEEFALIESRVIQIELIKAIGRVRGQKRMFGYF